MSNESMPFDDAMRRALDDGGVPPMSADFADRVVAATQTRAAPLPQPRRSPPGRWRTGRRVLIGALAAGALGTTAAATGLLEELGVKLPTPQEVWSVVSGQGAQRPEPVPTSPREAPRTDLEPRVGIEGPIDTPEELEEAFRRVDDARQNRRDMRRDRVDARLDAVLESRREQGLPAPTPEEEAQLRERLERMRENADQRREERTGERREALRERLEQEGEITREDIIGARRESGGNTPVADRLEQLRQLPPEERRARIREWRERRLDRAGQGSESATGEEAATPPEL